MKKETLSLIGAALFIALVFVTPMFTGCAVVKKTVRTAAEIAVMLCESTAAAYSERQLAGLSPRQWCAIEANLHPFIMWITEAQKGASYDAGLTEGNTLDAWPPPVDNAE